MNVLKSEKAKKMAPEDEWMYEFILQYLCSPMWKGPIQEFIDRHCGQFEGGETNLFSYTQVHQ